MSTAKHAASAIQTAVQPIASRSSTTCFSRWNTPRSSASIAKTNRLNSSQKSQLEGMGQNLERAILSAGPATAHGGLRARTIYKLQWMKQSRPSCTAPYRSRISIQPSRKGRIMDRQPGVYATLDTSEGTIVCRLFEHDAPVTVKNFIELAEGTREWTHPRTHNKSKSPLYNGTIFHRVIPDFMIQGGDPAGTGMGGPGYQFQDETKGSPNKFDKAGKLAMANSGPNTNGSQFFITVVPTQWLTGKHTI